MMDVIAALEGDEPTQSLFGHADRRIATPRCRPGVRLRYRCRLGRLDDRHRRFRRLCAGSDRPRARPGARLRRPRYWPLSLVLVAGLPRYPARVTAGRADRHQRVPDCRGLFPHSLCPGSAVGTVCPIGRLGRHHNWPRRHSARCDDGCRDGPIATSSPLERFGPDLFSAILLGALSSPGTPFRLFTEGAAPR